MAVGRRPLKAARLAWWFTVLGLAALVVGALWSVPWVPMNDGPQHLYGAWARNHAGDPAAGLDGLVSGNQPVTSNGYAQLFMLIEPALGWRDAHRAVLTLVALLWAGGVLALATALHRRRAALGLLGFASALSWSFYIGLLPFLLATALGFFITALAVARPPRRPLDFGALAALLAVEATVHVFPAAVTGIVIVSLVFAGAAPGGARARAVLATAAAGVPAALIALLATSGAEGTAGDWRWDPLVDRALAIGTAFVGGPAWRAWPAVAVAALGALSLAAGPLRWRARAPAERALLVTGLGLVAASFVIPETAGGWQLASTRTLSMGLVALAVLVPLERASARARGLATAVLACVALASIAWSIALHARAAVALDDVLDALDARPGAPPHGLRFSVVAGPVPAIDGGVLPHWQPLRGLGPLFCTAQGGVPWNVFAGVDAVDHLLWTDEDALPPLPSEPYMNALAVDGAEALVGFSADVGRQLGSVVVYEPAELHDLWLARGWVADHVDRSVLVARFVGCSVSVTPPAGAVAMDSAMAPRRPDGLVRRSVLGRGTSLVEGMPCGAVAVSFVDAAGQPVPCARSTVDVARAGAAFACD